jgi:dUTPase
MKVIEGKLFKKYYSDAGYDIFSKEKVLIYPNEMKTISTGLKVEIPIGYYG